MSTAVARRPSSSGNWGFSPLLSNSPSAIASAAPPIRRTRIVISRETRTPAKAPISVAQAADTQMLLRTTDEASSRSGRAATSTSAAAGPLRSGSPTVTRRPSSRLCTMRLPTSASRTRSRLFGTPAHVTPMDVGALSRRPRVSIRNSATRRLRACSSVSAC